MFFATRRVVFLILFFPLENSHSPCENVMCLFPTGRYLGSCDSFRRNDDDFDENYQKGKLGFADGFKKSKKNFKKFL